jgi:hypothetical protein
MKLNGWIRVGIVASLLWMFAIIAIATYEFRAHRLSQSKLISWKAKTGEDYAQVSKTTGEFSDLVPFHAALAPRFFAYLILPVLCGWIVAYIVVYTVLWIIAGFRTKKT